MKIKELEEILELIEKKTNLSKTDINDLYELEYFYNEIKINLKDEKENFDLKKLLEYYKIYNKLLNDKLNNRSYLVPNHKLYNISKSTICNCAFLINSPCWEKLKQ